MSARGGSCSKRGVISPVLTPEWLGFSPQFFISTFSIFSFFFPHNYPSFSTRVVAHTQIRASSCDPGQSAPRCNKVTPLLWPTVSLTPLSSLLIRPEMHHLQQGFLQPSVCWELEGGHQQATNSRRTETTSSFQRGRAKLAASEAITRLKKLVPFMPVAE